MIKQLGRKDLPKAAVMIRESFATVARQLGLTKENCPTHTSFITDKKLKSECKQGWLMFGLYDGERLVGFVSLREESEGTYKLGHLAVLPAYRHMGCGKALLDFCKEQAGICKIAVAIIEENTTLKTWYMQNGFVHTGTKRFDHLPFTVGYMEYTP